MRRFITLALAILASLLVGCSKPVSSTSAGSLDQPFSVETWASSDCVQPGEKIKLRSTVTNLGSGTLQVELTGQPVLDIWLSSGTTVLARWSDGRPLGPDLERLELKPGESKIIEMDWTVSQPRTETVLSVQTRFTYSTRVPPLRPTVLVNVSVCPGPFGP